MKSLFKTIIEVFSERGRVDIRRRVLRLVLFGSLLSLVLLSILSVIGILLTWNVLNCRGADLSKTAAGGVEHFATEQAHLHLLEIAQSKARLIRFELQSSASDVKYLAAQAHRILSHPQNYFPLTLPDARQQPIGANEVYVFRSRTLLENPDPTVENEIALLSNIAAPLRIMAKDFYEGFDASVIVGSKNDYMICVDTDDSTHAEIFNDDDFLNTFTPRARPWYKIAIAANSLIFTDLYFSPDGAIGINCAMPYYDTAGVAGVVSVGGTLDSLYLLILDVAQSGSDISFLLDGSGHVIMSSKTDGALQARGDKTLLEYDTLSRVARRMMAGEKGVMPVKVDGTEYFLAFAPVGISGWSFATMLENNKVIAPALEARRNIEQQIDTFKSSFSAVFVALLIIASLAVTRLFYDLIKNSIKVSTNFVKPIEELSQGVREITSGNFNQKLNIKTGDEIEHLATCFNAMTAEIQTYMKNLTRMTAEKERIAAELDVATEIQTSMLPQNFDFDRTDFELFATMQGTKGVGGDFYDFYFIDKDRLMLTIGDVSDEGVAASLFMVMSKTILQNFAMTMTGAEDVGALVTCTSRQLCQNNEAVMFVTAFVAMIDLKTGRMTYVNAAHNPPFIYRAATGRFEYIKNSARNYPLGLTEDADYAQETLKLSKGDVIFMYTAGVTETLNDSDEMFGKARLEECLNNLDAKSLTMEEMLATMKDALNDFAGDSARADAAAMIGFRYRGDADD